MAILKAEHSKATPYDGIAYILNRRKTEAWGCQNLDESQGPNARYFARQIGQTMAMYGKGKRYGERKYYHYKVSFHPDDRSENGGSLTAKAASEFAREYAKKHWPGCEVVWSIHGDGAARHIHFIVSAVSLETGKKLQVSERAYQKMKDNCQEMCVRYGLIAIDWRKATSEKRQREKQSDAPIEETVAERGIKAKGGKTWKDEIRSIVDEAAKKCKTMDEFRTELARGGVTITRCSDMVISYKLGDHKAVRGDSLGGDYTAEAIRSALETNTRESEKTTVVRSVTESGKRAGLADQIGRAEGQRGQGGWELRVIEHDERRILRELGRACGAKRSTIDALCDHAPAATWEEKQGAWREYMRINAKFWDEYKYRSEQLRVQIDEAYKLRRKVKDAEWAINSKNAKRTMLSMITAALFLGKNKSLIALEAEIMQLRAEQGALRRKAAEIRTVAIDSRETLKKKNLPLGDYLADIRLESYMGAVGKLQDAVERVCSAGKDKPMTIEEMAKMADLRRQRREIEDYKGR